MNISQKESLVSNSSANYHVVGPISLAFASISIFISLTILIIILYKKDFHHVIYLLQSETCLSSIFYCIVQWNNYIHLLFLNWNISDISCRWRSYFGYMSIIAVIYSYLLQSISRYICINLSMKSRYLISFDIHWIFILIKWFIVILLPLPSLLTKDIYYRTGFLCWVPKQFYIHVTYTFIFYYFIPIFIISILYLLILHRIRSNPVNQYKNRINQNRNRDIQVYRRLMVLLGIYIAGGIPLVFYMITGVEFFYSAGIVSVTLTVIIEKLTSIFIDRKLRIAFQNVCKRTGMPIHPIVVRHYQ